MNIFVVDQDPVISARSLCDCHVVKMILESAQLLCTHDIINGDERPYKKTHENHPCQKALSNINNYVWLSKHLEALLLEYKFRYNREHACTSLFNSFWKEYSKCSIDFTNTDFPKCMPDEYKAISVVESYKKYYQFKKKTLVRFRYTGRNEPAWLSNMEVS